MFFDWFQRRRRRKLLAKPFPPGWLEILEENVAHYASLLRPEQARLRDKLRVFIAEKEWEGCNGLEVTDEMRVTIAALACLLIVNLDEPHFDMVQTILIYPDSYFAPEHRVNQAGVVFEGPSHRAGEAWYRGPVVLSWHDALAGGRRTSPGHNLVLHEFAHQLDMENGRAVDGIPPLESAELAKRWERIILREFEQLQSDCQAHRSTVLDCYGATHIAEFFAVATEAFFESPHDLALHHPELYDILREFYGQDPADRD